MCLAIYKPKGIEIAKRYLRNGMEQNGDGAGFAITHHGKVEIFKGYFTFKEFWKAYKPYSRQQALIHFRWATHGGKGAFNCHPFSICSDEYAVIHNGVIDIDTKLGRGRSDTAIFCELVLEPMLRRVPFNNQALKYLVETSIGKYNKIALLRGDGKFIIFNENQGQWHKGAWFSNDGYKREWTLGFGSTSYGSDWETADWQSDWYKDSKGVWRKHSDNPDTGMPAYAGSQYKQHVFDEEEEKAAEAEMAEELRKYAEGEAREPITQAEQDEIITDENKRYSDLWLSKVDRQK